MWNKNNKKTASKKQQPEVFCKKSVIKIFAKSQESTCVGFCC